ncbi:MAG: ABC transporter permease [Erysipelotrichaceae bacterium]
MTTTALLISMIPAILYYTAPICIAALGGLFSERSGIVNIALEGIMLVGAFFAAIATYYIEQIPGMQGSAPWIALIIAMIAGIAFSWLHAYASINLNADQTISGTALNILATGLTVFFCQILFQQERSIGWAYGLKKGIPGLNELPIIGDFISKNYATIWLAIILVFVSWFVLYKTAFGLRLRSCGEYPQAAASVGINVSRMRYIGVLTSGALAGLAGGVMVLTLGSGQFTAFVVHGFGFIALATLIFGKWNPFGILGASLFFGFSQVLSLYANDLPLLNQLPAAFFYIFPYVITIFALIVFAGKAAGPKAAGEIYDSGKR